MPCILPFPKRSHPIPEIYIYPVLRTVPSAYYCHVGLKLGDSEGASQAILTKLCCSFYQKQALTLTF